MPFFGILGAMDGIAIVLPAYEPGEALCGLVDGLSGEFDPIVVVDDGSASESAAAAFRRLENRRGVMLLRHAANRGKGAALKTAFARILADFPGVKGVVTADADGQHLPGDIRRVAEATLANPGRFTLGVRAFDGEVPFRSRLGNAWTQWEFFLLTGVMVRDTQTGLRGIPRDLLRQAAQIPGERYEYESRMLVAAARLRARPVQIPVATVYLDGNAASHYRPFADTVRTQFALFAARLSGRQ